MNDVVVIGDNEFMLNSVMVIEERSGKWHVSTIIERGLCFIQLYDSISPQEEIIIDFETNSYIIVFEKK